MVAAVVRMKQLALAVKELLVVAVVLCIGRVVPRILLVQVVQEWTARVMLAVEATRECTAAAAAAQVA